MQANRFKYNYWVFFFGLFLLTTSCVEDYWPELNESDKQFLVVDGKISNFIGPYTIRLSLTNSPEDTSFVPQTSATITIIDNNGNSEVLEENDPGIYKTATGGIQGVIGHSYKVRIELSNGKIYESEYEELLNPIGVEEVYYKEEWQYAQNELEIDQEGYHFYVNSNRSSSTQTYLSWEIEETYEYHSEYQIFYFYDGSIKSEGESNLYGLKKMKNRDSLYYCWKTQKLPKKFSYSLEHLAVPEAKKQPLHFIPFTDKRLRFGYNILIKQYTISKAAYTFLDHLEKQNKNQGSIFTTQPFQIRGNLKNIQDPTEQVLGYFMTVGGALGPRMQTRVPTYLQYEKVICFADPSPGYIHNRIRTSTSSDWPIYFTYYFFEFGDPPGTFLAYVSPNCLDCTRHNGIAIKPDFWQE